MDIPRAADADTIFHRSQSVSKKLFLLVVGIFARRFFGKLFLPKKGFQKLDIVRINIVLYHSVVEILNNTN